LETQLGFRVFNRTTRNVSLTSYGTRLLPVIRRNLAELDAAMSQLGETAKAADQSISVGAPPLVAANILSHAIKEFAEHRPGVRVSAFDANLTAIMQRIQSGKLDLGIGIFKNAAGVRRTRLFQFSFVLIRAGSQPGALHTSTTWSAAASETLIVLPPESPLQQAIDKHLGRGRRTGSRPMTVNALDTQIAMVEAGQGAAIIPSFGLPACRNRNVLTTRLVNPAVTMDFHEIRNRGRQLSQAADEFSLFLQGHIAKWAGRAGVV
jgi:DNA-binding transcriptional LysR family regulator